MVGYRGSDDLAFATRQYCIPQAMSRDEFGLNKYVRSQSMSFTIGRSRVAPIYNTLSIHYSCLKHSTGL